MPKCYLSACLLAVLITNFPGLHADVLTTPVGYVTVPVKASPDGASYSVTQFSAPLQSAASITGLTSGRISSITANTISNTAGGWTASALAGASAPFFVKITSGASVGRILNITANTATTLTVNTQGLDLSSANVVTGTTGDTFEIFPGYTLLSLLGNPTEGVIGGTAAQYTAHQLDKVLINDAAGVARFYYYDTTAAHWMRVGSSSSQDTLLISPFSGLAYYRISATALSFVFSGKVPNTNAKIQVPTSGTTLFSSYYPFTSTLAALSLNTLPAWRKLGDAGVTLNDTDRILTQDSLGVLRSYYFDGTSWRRVGSPSVQDAIPVVAGTAIYCTRFGSGSNETWTRTLPYSLN